MCNLFLSNFFRLFSGIRHHERNGKDGVLMPTTPADIFCSVPGKKASLFYKLSDFCLFSQKHCSNRDTICV